MNRKITAHYLYPGNGDILKSGIIYLDEERKLIKIEDTRGLITESERLEFYSGLILPAIDSQYVPNSLLNEYGMKEIHGKLPAHRYFVEELKIIQKTFGISTPELLRRHLSQKLTQGQKANLMLITNIHYPLLSFREDANAEILV